MSLKIIFNRPKSVFYPRTSLPIEVSLKYSETQHMFRWHFVSIPHLTFPSAHLEHLPYHKFRIWIHSRISNMLSTNMNSNLFNIYCPLPNTSCIRVLKTTGMTHIVVEIGKFEIWKHSDSRISSSPQSFFLRVPTDWMRPALSNIMEGNQLYSMSIDLKIPLEWHLDWCFTKK